MVKLIIGLTGVIGAGKTVVSDYLVKNYSFKTISSGDLVRAECKTHGLIANRENAQALAKTMVEQNGNDYWTKQIIDKIQKSNYDFIIFDGIRYSIDFDLTKKTFKSKFILIQIDTKEQLRFERMKLRNRTGDPKTISEFEKQEQNELKLFDLNYLFEKKDFVVYNNEDIDALHKQIDSVVKMML